MGYLGLRLGGLGIKIMLRLGSYVFKSYRNQILFLSTGLGSILGNPNCFRKEYLSKIFVAKMKKTLVIVSQKYYMGYAFVNKKVESLSLIYC